MNNKKMLEAIIAEIRAHMYYGADEVDYGYEGGIGEGLRDAIEIIEDFMEKEKD